MRAQPSRPQPHAGTILETRPLPLSRGVRQPEERSKPHDWDECHPYLAEPCSEDHADDFAVWVVMQGVEFYGEVASHPERIHQYLEMFDECEAGRGHTELRWVESVDRDDYLGCQRADFIASAIYRSRFGGSILEACYDNRGRPHEGLD